MDLPDELRIPDDVLEKLQEPETFRKYIEEGKSLQEIIGYSDELMEEMYQAACQVFREGHHQEAEDAFLFLTTINPYVYAYWLGLGMSYHLLEEYEQAILGYDCAMALDKTNPIPYYHKASCYYLLGEKNESIDALKGCLERCKDEHKELKEKAEVALRKVEKKK